MDLSTLTREGLLLVAAATAGAVNAVAGGGTLITFPALIWLGMPSITANATSTVGLVPGALSGTWGYRREVRESAQWLAWLLPSSILGGLAGALFLVKTPPALFDRLAPLLVLGATALFMLQERISRRVAAQASEPGAAHRIVVAIVQLVIAVYGGYFGAGMGIMSLAALGLLHLGSIHRMNGLKTFTGGTVNGVASVMFIGQGMVRWPEAVTMAVGSVLGGYLAADGARRLGQRTVRRMVVAVGLTATVILAAQRLLG
jgi:uncharacterized membrane protein YfcA